MLEPKNPNGDPLRKPLETDTEKSDTSKSGSPGKKS
jgi:hypothetical protein